MTRMMEMIFLLLWVLNWIISNEEKKLIQQLVKLYEIEQCQWTRTLQWIIQTMFDNGLVNNFLSKSTRISKFIIKKYEKFFF